MEVLWEDIDVEPERWPDVDGFLIGVDGTVRHHTHRDDGVRRPITTAFLGGAHRLCAERIDIGPLDPSVPDFNETATLLVPGQQVYGPAMLFGMNPNGSFKSLDRGDWARLVKTVKRPLPTASAPH